MERWGLHERLALSVMSVTGSSPTRLIAGMMLATGAWLRAVLALGAVAGGAEPALGPMLTDVILPGMFLDLVLLTVVYIPLRLAGIPGRGMTLQRSRYY